MAPVWFGAKRTNGCRGLTDEEMETFVETFPIERI
jgi:hypothetical protein